MEIGEDQCPICRDEVADMLDKEVRIRRRILKDFNKRRENFNTLLEYNDYLEMVEDIIYNLVSDRNVEETKALVAKYQAENQSIIVANRSKKAEEDRRMRAQLAEEAAARERQKHETELKFEAEAAKTTASLKRPSRRKDEIEVEAVPLPSAPPVAKLNSTYTPQSLLPTPYAQPQPITTPQIADDLPEAERKEAALKAAGWIDDYNRKRSLEEAFAGLQMAKSLSTPAL